MGRYMSWARPPLCRTGPLAAPGGGVNATSPPRVRENCGSPSHKRTGRGAAVLTTTLPLTCDMSLIPWSLIQRTPRRRFEEHPARGLRPLEPASAAPSLRRFVAHEPGEIAQLVGVEVGNGPEVQ